MRVKPNVLRFLPPVVMMLVIFVFSSQPGSVFPHYGWWDVVWENGGHFLGYALLGAAWWYALRQGRSAWGWSVLYALSDEFHQFFVPGRAADWRDVVVDALGAALAVFLSAKIAHSQNAAQAQSSRVRIE